MKRNTASLTGVVAIGGALLWAGLTWAAPSVFPVGTTIYQPDKAWNGYTVLSSLGVRAAIVIDMNGKVVKQWDGYNNNAGGPVRVLPGGIVIGPEGALAGRQESLDLVERDFDGKQMWHFDHTEQVSQNGTTVWAARQHRDWERADFPAGYYSPNATPAARGVNTLLLTHIDHSVAKVAGNTMLEDDKVIEVSPDGKILWQWIASDHVDELRLDAGARKALAGGSGRTGYNWFHTNTASYVGPNRWYDAGDKRFAPENVIISSRETSIVAIVARDGSLVWRIGPDYSVSPEMRAIGQVVGQHSPHIIPKGLPGAGNLLMLDNGSSSGYGNPSPTAPNGRGIYARATSRVLEIDPVTLKVVWSFAAATFYGANVGGAQRLLNGNTLITEGPDGRVFEVTPDGTIVWEFVFPNFSRGARPTNSLYRAYRIPYSWLPQLAKPTEKAVTPPAPGELRLP